MEQNLKPKSTFTLDDIIKVSEYVRVSSKSTPDKKTSELVNEYFDIKKINN